MRHRQRGQITPVALFAMVALVGAVALVVDAGVFFVTQRQLQTAADAAALAAAWYKPVCNFQIGTTVPPADHPHCEQIEAADADKLPPGTWPACGALPDASADCIAEAVVQRHVEAVGGLCRSIDVNPPLGSRFQTVNGLNSYIVSIDCEAPYWFARIFSSIPATMKMTAFARATIGRGTATGVDDPTCVDVPTCDADPLRTRLLT